MCFAKRFTNNLWGIYPHPGATMICGHNFIVTQIKSHQPSPYMTQVRGKAIHSTVTSNYIIHFSTYVVYCSHAVKSIFIRMIPLVPICQHKITNTNKKQHKVTKRNTNVLLFHYFTFNNCLSSSSHCSSDISRCCSCDDFLFSFFFG